MSSGATVTVAAVGMAAGDQVAQVALALGALEQALIEHPVVVEHLGEILVAAVADEA